MSAVEWVGFLVATQPPLQPERPEPPRPLPGNGSAAGIIMGSVVLMMVVPMIMIWSFHRPIEALRARCEAAGGRLGYTSLDGSGPYRCELSERGLR